MFKNKEYFKMIVIACIVTVISSVPVFCISGTAAGCIVLACGIILCIVFSIYTKKRYKDIDDLNTYLSKVLAGNDVPDITDQEEGELSILKTNIYKATTTLKFQKELLAEDKKMLADAIADISHQLKTPLTSMMVMNDLLLNEDDTDKREEFLKTQSTQLGRMNWLIQTLLKLSKLDAGTALLKSEKILGSILVSDALKPFEIQIELKEISKKITGSEIDINCDRNWTLEAVQNIIKNCIEHMEEGGELGVETSETNLYSEIKISDTGCGIDEADLPHIFERFYKGKNASGDSVGIGLALAKTIMTSQHGDIIVESTVGKGSTFFIRFYKTII
ncbi:MAG: HAMP domain-containing histidine kinase [Lachnospiraceae bacterium]|nr:HAMP domain-containing histidine kinase [Lachnospiraceae bacterium]